MILREPQGTVPFSCVLFDMDGTLLDSAKGVTASAAEALDAVGATVPDSNDIEGATASGMPTIFAQWGYGSPDESAQALAVCGLAP